MKSGYLALTVVALSLLFVPAVANASLQVSNVTSTPVSDTKTDWANSLTFDKFDQSLGILQSIDLKLTGDVSTQLTVTNNGTSLSSGTAYTEVTYTVQDAGNHLIGSVPDVFSPHFDFTDLAPGPPILSGALTKTTSDTQTYTDSGTLAAFTGTGTITLAASTKTRTSISYTGGNSDADQSTDAGLTGTIYYNYITPEPATMALLAVGGLSVVMARRRRKA